MPAEWHPHEATWLVWPKDPRTWPERMEQVERIYVRIIANLTEGEQVRLIVDDADAEQRVRNLLVRAAIAVSRVQFLQLPTADSWIRDYGPNFLIRPGGQPPLAFNDWGFNAWGGKYPELVSDDSVPRRMEPQLGVPRFSPGMVLEGGSIDVNGRGACLTTEQCLLHPNRNPDLTRSRIEHRLGEYLSVDQVIWLGKGIAGDDTDGHVDDVARFVSPDTIVCCREEDPRDANFQPLEENWKRLRATLSPFGEPYKVAALPMPGPIEGGDGRLPASYANFYIANHAVLVPTFGQPNDRVALAVLQELFPKRKVIGIGSEALIWGLGAIHCVTQQQPRGNV